MPTMNRRLAAAAVLLSTPFAIAGCSFVTLDPEAEEVEILAPERASDCERLGQTRVTTADRVLFIPRGARAIEDDLDRLARNSTADMGGDTAVRKTDIEEGKATYEVFDCVR